MTQIYKFNEDHKRVFDEAFDQAIEAKGKRQFCSCVWALGAKLDEEDSNSNSNSNWNFIANDISNWVMNSMMKGEAFLERYLWRYHKDLWKQYTDAVDIPNDIIENFRVEWLTNIVKPAFYAIYNRSKVLSTIG